jgi:putative Mg2+ transporter-C (MgtC) family protein
MIGHGELLARIAIGAVLGGVIGYERDRHGRPVGLRTHLIVAMTAATFMVISTQFVYLQRYTEHDLVEVDASRIAASVVSGIGFLAGGAILRTGVTIQGLTTAAGLWLVTAIGMCAGSGMYVEGAFVTAMGVVALTVLRRFEDKDDSAIRRRVTVALSEEAHGIVPITAALKALGGTVAAIEYDRRIDEGAERIVAILDVTTPDSIDAPALVAAIEATPGVRRVHVRPPPV